MPDLAGGTTVKGNDTPPTVTDTQTGQYTITTTTFGVGTTGGTYVDCGVAFVAPTTGRVTIEYGGQQFNSTTNATILAPYVRTGATVGSGSDVLVASDVNNVQVTGTSSQRYGVALLLSSLTPGATYNVRLEHRVSAASTGTILRRYVIVSPAT